MSAKMPSAGDIIVVVACGGSGVEPESADALAFAGRLQDLAGGSVRVWVLGRDVDAAAREIARSSGFDVTALHSPELSPYTCEAYGSILVPALRQAAPDFAIAAHTSRGWEWAPGVAARIGAGCICGVDDVGLENGRIWFAKDRCGGKVKGRYVSGAATTLVTVQPGRFKFEARPGDHPGGKVVCHAVACGPGRTRFEGIRAAAPGASNLTDARVIVAAGNGIGDEENMKWIDRLAQRLPKAAVAGTRTVCDRGWLGYNRQVGVTGATVAPALYIACGISGAAQHVAGMRGSGLVIAINTDARAPICSEADVCIVEDLAAFIPLMLEALDKTTADKNGE